MKRGVVIGVCLGILVSVAFPILFEYTNIIISLLIFFGLIAALAVVALFVAVNIRMQGAFSSQGFIESTKGLIRDLLKNPFNVASIVKKIRMSSLR